MKDEKTFSRKQLGYNLKTQSSRRSGLGGRNISPLLSSHTHTHTSKSSKRNLLNMSRGVCVWRMSVVEPVQNLANTNTIARTSLTTTTTLFTNSSLIQQCPHIHRHTQRTISLCSFPFWQKVRKNDTNYEKNRTHNTSPLYSVLLFSHAIIRYIVG